MVIDASKGVEAQTRKLFKVCAMRHIPVFTFINKMDREARDIFDLLDEIEKELGIPTCPVNWPIGSGKQFAGVYDRKSQKIDLFEDTMKGTKMGTMKEIALDDPEISNYVTDEAKEVLEEEIELLDGASAEFDQELVDAGELSPVFFGSALMNFGVENFLNYFLKMTSSPLPRTSDQGTIDPIEEKDFSAFVFKIQANMNKAHRDRIAFMRICSGEFEAGMDAFHVQGDKKVRLSQPQQMMASERKMIDKAYAGDIIGIFVPGIFSIGDTITTSPKKFAYEGIPTFAPEHFARVRQVNTMKRKQFIKGINEIAQEGAIQVYTNEYNEVVLGAVGQLQFEVFEYRLRNEYNSEVRMESLDYSVARWVLDMEKDDIKELLNTRSTLVFDHFMRPLILFANQYTLNAFMEKNPDVKLIEAHEVKALVEDEK